jgi:hypothetical protein
MSVWFDENGHRRGDISKEAFDASVGDVVNILLTLAAEGPSSAEEVAAKVTGLNTRKAALLLDAIVEAGGATENAGDYTGVLVEDSGGD